MILIHSHCRRHQQPFLFLTFTVIISFIVIFVALPTLQQHVDDGHTISGEDFRRQRAAKAAVDQAKKQQKNQKQQQKQNSFIEINNHEEFIKTERLRSRGTDTPRSQQQQQKEDLADKIKNQAASDQMRQRLEEKRNRFMKSSSSSKSQTGVEDSTSTRKRNGGGGGTLLQRPSRGDGVSDPFIVNLQENAAPRINFNAPNFFLPSKITHLVEFEIVKAWRSVLVDLEKAFDGHEDDFDIERDENGKFLRAVPKKNTSDGNIGIIQKNNLEMMQKNLRNETWVREKGALVSNVTHWEVVGHTLVALFGEEEPELVQQFIQTTEKGYRSENNNTMADSFYGALPFVSSAARERQRQRIEKLRQNENVADDNFFFDGHFVAAKALPKELRHGFNGDDNSDNDESTSSSSSSLTVRPPWAERSRWVMSGNYQKSVAGFTFVDMESKKQTNQKRQNNNKKDDSSSSQEEKEEDQPEKRRPHKSSSSSSSPLTLRPGALLHRDCDNNNNNNNKNVFSWYALTSRQIAQILHTNELKEEAEKAFQEDKDQNNKNDNNNNNRRRRPDRTVPVDEEFLEKVNQLHEMTKNDRIFGQVLTGYPHFERLGNLPQHGKLFAHHHYLNRTKQQQQQQQQQQSSSSSSSSSSYIDEHPEEYFSPFVDGIPMQHVSISRASVYEMKYYNDDENNKEDEHEREHEKNSFFYNFLKNQRQSFPHAKPSPEISDYIEPREGGTAKEGNILLSKNLKPEERQEIVRRRFEKISEWDKKNDQLWRKYSFGRSISPFDLESDVRFARSEFTLKCPREFELAKKLYRQEENENENENKLGNFIRFTGGVPPLPNCTEAAILWQWCNYRNQKVVQAALHQRVARDPILRDHADDARRQERLAQKERVVAAEEDRRERRHLRRSRSASSSSSTSDSSLIDEDDSSTSQHHKDFVAQEMGRRKQKKKSNNKNPFHLEDIESSSLKKFASDLKQRSATNEAELSSTMHKVKQNTMHHAKQKQQQQQRQKKQSGGSKSRDKMYSNVRVSSEDLDEATQEEVTSRNSRTIPHEDM